MSTTYRLDVATDSNFSAFVPGYHDLDVGAVTSYAVTGLSSLTNYYYRLRAVNDAGPSPNSNTISLTTANVAPNAPTAIAATNVAGQSFDANWNANPNTTGYRLDVSTDIGFGSFVTGFNNQDVSNVTTFSVTGLNYATTYYFRVRAYNLIGTSGNSNVVTAVTSAAPITPQSFPGLIRWYRAKDLDFYSDNTVVGQTGVNPWIDQTGSGDNAQNIGGGPIIKKNIVGTASIIRFDNPSTGGFLLFAPPSLGDCTIVCACRSPAGRDSFLNDGATSGLRRSFGGTNHLRFTAGAGIDSVNFSTNDFMMCVARRSAGTVTFFQNLINRGTGANATGWQVTQIGISTISHALDLGEYCLYNTALSDADILSLYNDYLKGQWSTLP